MLNALILFLTCLMVSSVGFAWGIYESQKTYNLPKDEIIAGTKEILRNMGRPKPKLASDIAKADDADKGAKAEEKKEPVKVDDTPSRHTLPKEKLRIQIPDKPKEPEKPPEPDAATLRKQRLSALISEGDKIYNEAMTHLQNTFKRDNNFDKENDLAAKQFSQAVQKYTEAQDLDPTSKTLQTKIREANQCIKTCRIQGRRK
ncbi:MAG: hypothetical protein WC980_07625 [Candidatus Brocadiia bacterium]